MRNIRAVVLVMAMLSLTTVGLGSAPSATAAPNCAPDPVTGALTAVAGPQAVGIRYACTIPVHPGAYLSVDGSHGGNGGGCTANFVFRGSDGRTYLGTAGHCTLAASALSGDNGEHIHGDSSGARVRDRNDRVIGRIAYAIQQGEKDFALIRLEPGIAVDAALPHWGSVSGINTSTATSATALRWVGHGTGIGQVAYARSGVAFGTPDPDEIRSFGAISPGDSGGPVVDGQGRAVGVNVAIGASVSTSPTNEGPQVITRLKPQLDRAAWMTGTVYTLA